MRVKSWWALSLLILSTQIQCSPALRSTVEAQSSSTGVSSRSLYLYMMGELAQLEGDNQKALEFFTSASQLDPESKTLKFKQAEQLVVVGRVSDAKRILEALDHYGTADFYLLKSRIAVLELDVEQGLLALDAALKIFSKSRETQRYRETLLMKVALLSDARRYKESISELKTFLRTDPDDEIAYYFLGKIYSITQEKELAIQAYLKALEIKPHFLTASKALGLQYELDGKVDEAIAVYSRALVFATNDYQLRSKLANLLLANEKFEAALEHLEFLNASNPDDTQNQLRTALVLLKVRQFPEAEKILKSLLAGRVLSADRLNFYLGAVYEEQSRFSDAVVQYRKVKLDSEYFVESQLQAAYLLGDRLKDTSKSIQVLNEAVGLRPHNRELYLALAGQYERISQMQEAVRVLERATEMVPRDEKILFVLGSFLDRVGQAEASIEKMRMVLEINPNHAHAMNHIGYVYTERRTNLDEAEKLLIRAVQLEPQNGFIVDSLGWLYFQKSNYRKAREFLERAEALSPNEAVILEHLADAYMKLGMQKQALQMYQKVVKVSGGDSEPTNPLTENSIQRRVLQKISSLEEEKLH